MRWIVILLAAGLLSAAARADPLDRYLWQNRVLIVFAPSFEDPRLIDQRELNVHAIEGLRDRDMVIFAVVGNARINPELGSAPLDSAQALRQRFGVAQNRFAIVLVGKDGGEKYRSSRPVEPALIFDLVDGMPMRRRELRERRI